MKIVDQTPFYKENGEMSLIDRGKAIMQFGSGWFKEIEAQRLVAAVLKKNLDKNFTLLINIIPPGLEARIPMILVGPTGVYVMSVTPKIGMFRARGDQWGTVSGSSLRPETPNLLTLTDKMARAVQLYLQRQNNTNLTNVEAVLLCSDPATTVDSMRPIIRVIMRDSLERFAISIAQARIILTPEAAFDIVNRLRNPPPPPPSRPEETEAQAAAVEAPKQPEESNIPAFALPKDTAAAPATPALFPSISSEAAPTTTVRPRRRAALSSKQILMLVGMAIIWCIIVIVFGFLIARNLH